MGSISYINHKIPQTILQIWNIDESNQWSNKIIYFLQNQMLKSNNKESLRLTFNREYLYMFLRQKNIEKWYLEQGCELDDNDKRIIYTALLFLPLWYNSSVKRISGNILFQTIEQNSSNICLNVEELINDFTYLFYLIMQYHNYSYNDIINCNVNLQTNDKKLENYVFCFNSILNCIDNCQHEIRWNNIAEDWNILRSESIVRDIYIFIMAGGQFYNNNNILLNFNPEKSIKTNLDFNNKLFKYYNSIEKQLFIISLIIKLGLKNKIFFSEYFLNQKEIIQQIKEFIDE